MAELHRLRIAVDVIHDGPKLSPSARRNVARSVSTHAHVLAFDNIKNVGVIYGDPDERVSYAHYHDSSGGGYCDVRGQGCLTQGRDGLNQEGLA